MMCGMLVQRVYINFRWQTWEVAHLHIILSGIVSAANINRTFSALRFRLIDCQKACRQQKPQT
ncbi:MAG: hypothetical protein LBE35_11040 [Clostridiales bacterium]|nr:hypothetical protein [Clostridiales bacterium]